MELKIAESTPNDGIVFTDAEQMEINLAPQMGINLAPRTDDGIVFTSADCKEVLRITMDKRVIVSGDIYDAAKAFWNVVVSLTPQGYSTEVSQ